MKDEYDRLSEQISLLDQKIAEKMIASNEAMIEAGNLDGQVKVIEEQIRAEEMNAEHIRNRLNVIELELGEKEDSKRRYEAEHNA